ncbi:unnamed protein product, partial [Ectocarpus sp. 12 AP-2014]
GCQRRRRTDTHTIFGPHHAQSYLKTPLPCLHFYPLVETRRVRRPQRHQISMRPNDYPTVSLPITTTKTSRRSWPFGWAPPRPSSILRGGSGRGPWSTLTTTARDRRRAELLRRRHLLAC